MRVVECERPPRLRTSKTSEKYWNELLLKSTVMGGEVGHGHGHGHSDPELRATEERVAKILARASVAKPREYPWPSSDTSGVLPMRISSRFRQERQRLSDEFTEKWRKWRIQFLKDQDLHPSEPLYIKQYDRETNNIFRRIYKAPGNYFEQHILVPRVGKDWAFAIRRLIFRAPLFWLAGVWIWYSAKYTHRTWEERKKVNAHYEKKAILPGDPSYPLANPRPHKWQFNDQEFSKRKVFLD